MLHMFQEAIDLFDELKAKVTGAAAEATKAVASGVTWTEDELKSAEVAAFSALETTELTLSQAFAQGAKWAAARVAVATAQPPASSGNEQAGTSTSADAAPASSGTAPAQADSSSGASAAQPTEAAAWTATGAPAA